MRQSEDADSIRGPVGGNGLPDDPAGNRSPIAAVVGVAAIVAHHEPVAGRDPDRRGEVALRAQAAGFDVGVLLLHEPTLLGRPAEDVSFADVDFVSRTGNGALDEVFARLAGHRLRAGCTA